MIRLLAIVFAVFSLQWGCRTVMANDEQASKTQETPEAPKELVPAPQEAKVVFIKVTGGLSKKSKGNKEDLCEVKADHEEVKGKLEELAVLIEKAAKADFQTAYHFRAQVPSIELFAVHPQSSEKVLLLEDFSAMKTRNGPEAKKLLELAQKLCP